MALLQKRPIILRSLLIVATPYLSSHIIHHLLMASSFDSFSDSHSFPVDILRMCDAQHTLQPTATHCNPLQPTATHGNPLQHTATHCNPLQPTATHGNTLQHTATHCNTLQQAATHQRATLSLLTFCVCATHACVYESVHAYVCVRVSMRVCAYAHVIECNSVPVQ